MDKVGAYDADRQLVGESEVLADGSIHPPLYVPAGGYLLWVTEPTGPTVRCEHSALGGTVYYSGEGK